MSKVLRIAGSSNGHNATTSAASIFSGLLTFTAPDFAPLDCKIDRFAAKFALSVGGSNPSSPIPAKFCGLIYNSVFLQLYISAESDLNYFCRAKDAEVQGAETQTSAYKKPGFAEAMYAFK